MLELAEHYHAVCVLLSNFLRFNVTIVILCYCTVLACDSMLLLIGTKVIDLG